MIDLRDFAQQATVDALAWTLLHFLWQGALLGFVAFMLLRFARPERATTRYAIGVATLALMLVACVATFAILSSQSDIERSRDHGLPDRRRLGTRDHIAHRDRQRSHPEQHGAIDRPGRAGGVGVVAARAAWSDRDLRARAGVGHWRVRAVVAPARRMDADTQPHASCDFRGAARDRHGRGHYRGSPPSSPCRRDRRVGRRRGADARRLDEAGCAAARRCALGPLAGAAAGNPRPRARARPSPRLSRQPVAVDGRDAALLSSGDVVGVGAGTRRARALLRRSCR